MKIIKLKDWAKEAQKVIDENEKRNNAETKPSKNNDSPSLRNPLPGRKVPKR